MSELTLSDLILLAAEKQVLKKAVCSKSLDKTVLRAVITLRAIGKKAVLQVESFHSDNKAKHENIELSDRDRLNSVLQNFLQVNLLSEVGDCELRVSKSGKSTLLGGDKLFRQLGAADRVGSILLSNDRQKDRILHGDEPFLKLLDVSDENGRIRDKKQSKFRQINRFLELVRDCLDRLPKDGPLRVCDLCCGKSYLSFAAYHYFANVLGREVKMTGVDLKPDVVEYCNKVAKTLGFDGLEFLCGDISAYDAGEKVHLVISLHACDVATDLVLASAVRWNADVILSTPCCHHELNHNLDCGALSFLSGYSMLRQKFCDAATDALRLKFLEANGYDTAALELIDPEETPKNIMLRGLRKEHFDKNSDAAKRKLCEYLDARSFLTGGLSNVQSALCEIQEV